MTDICCIGHITLDEIITDQQTSALPGGTAWYFSLPLQHLPVQYELVTAVAPPEQAYIRLLEQKGIRTTCYTSAKTLHFVNRYAANQNERSQLVMQEATPFTGQQLAHVTASVIHLGPLVSHDIPDTLIPALAERGRLSLDLQGYLREVKNRQVLPVQWRQARQYLPYLHYVKVNEYELAVLTGTMNVREGARKLAAMGVKEVIVTMGSEGSFILHEGLFTAIPAYPPMVITDATGCGDTYMAGYLYQRVKGAGIEAAGQFGAAMATLKIARSGAFEGTETEVLNVLSRH
jgi:sugar/nucleoside kinase (ribokinase family)